MEEATRTDGLQGLGHLFDGRSTQRALVHVLLVGDVLRVSPDQSRSNAATAAMPIRHPLSQLKVSEPFDGVPFSVALPDGGTLWIDQADRPLGEALFERTRRLQRGVKRPRVYRLIRAWPAVVACLLGTLGLVAWYDRQGAALAATMALHVMPHSVDEAVGDLAWRTIDKQWLTKSQVGGQRQAALQARFQELAQRIEPNRSFSLRFHRMKPEADDPSGTVHEPHDHERDANHDPERAGPLGTPGQPEPSRPGSDDDGGFNAFALPNGTLVVLDGITNKLSDDELLVVLGHEVGHVVHRHSMKHVVQAFSLLAVANVMLGDFSSVAATAVSALQTFRYSRDAEREADAYGRGWARQAGLPPGTEAAVWRKFKVAVDGRGADAVPGWLSTHPSTDERLNEADRLERAASQPAAEPGLR